jgi:GMP synthase-like glutamine amidotransferase
VTLTSHGKSSNLFAGFPDAFEVLQWHGDTFDVPEGADLLATAELCANQAFSHGRAYGIQFHVEARPEMIEEWLAADSGWTHTDFDLDEEKVVRDAHTLAPTMKGQCYRLLDNLFE